MKTALVIMAAGIGSRFGKGIKQLTPVGPNGEMIIDYSIHDALEAGFTEIVFVIRRELEPLIRETVGDKIACRRAEQALGHRSGRFILPGQRKRSLCRHQRG